MKLLKPVVLAVFALSTISLSAQETVSHKKTPAEKAEKFSEKMKETYSLTDEQADKLEASKLDFVTRARKIKADESITKEVKKAQLQAAKAVHDAKVKETLTAEQFTKYEADVAKKMEERQAKREVMKTPEGRAKHQTDHMTSSLDLTPEQKEQVEQLNLKVAQKIQAVRENETLTQDQKVEFINGNKEDQKRVLKTILSDEQFAKWEEMQAAHKEKAEARKAKKKAMKAEQPDAE